MAIQILIDLVYIKLGLNLIVCIVKFLALVAAASAGRG